MYRLQNCIGIASGLYKCIGIVGFCVDCAKEFMDMDSCSGVFLSANLGSSLAAANSGENGLQ